MKKHISKLWIGVMVSFATFLHAGTPHLGYGTLRYADGTTPSSATFSAYVTARSTEKLTQASYGCSYSSGTWTVQVGNFPSAWTAGQILHVDFNDGAGKTGSAEIALTNEPADNAGKTVLSQNPVAKLSLPNIRATRGSQVDIPVALSGLGVADSIVAYQITLKFDPAVLLALGAKSTGTMTQNWGAPTTAPREDRISITGFTANSPATRLVPDAGNLVYATFLVHGVPTNPASYATAIQFEEALLYVIKNDVITEVVVSHIKTGTVTVDPGSNPTTRDLTLNTGWNLISLGIIPSPNSVPDVFGSLTINYAFGYRPVEGPMSWDKARPAFLNDLKILDGIHGYWIKSGETTAKTWHVAGDAMAVQTPIPLYSGWNLIGYLPASSDKISHALASVDPLFSYVSGFESGAPKVWDRSKPDFLNDLRNLKQFGGYWVKMDDPRQLVYPTGGYSVAKWLATLPPPLPLLKDGVVVTPYWCDFWGVKPELLSEGDTIRVYDPDDVLCGETQVTPEGGFIVHVFGDDPNTTLDDEGALEGDTLLFQINGRNANILEGDPGWQYAGSKEIVLELESQPPDSFWCRFWGIQPDTLFEGDTIRVFDPDGLICGETLVDVHGAFSLAVAGDDTSTLDMDEGALPGDTLVFLVNGDTAFVKEGSPVWEKDGTKEIVLEAPSSGTSGSSQGALPRSTLLRDNYPNPFNPETTIRFQLARRQSVLLSVYDQTGKWVCTLVDETRGAGSYDVRWNGSNHSGRRVASGIYFIRLSTPESVQTRKCLLVK